MYKSATRVNPAFLKRLNKQVWSPYRVFPPRSEPVRSKGSNALPAFGVKAQSCLTGHHTKHSKKLHPLNSPSLLVQLQKKYKFRSCNKLFEDGFNNASTIRSARMFSGKPNEKENMEKKSPTSLELGQNKDEKEAGRSARKLSKKPLSEASALSQGDQNLEANNVQRHEHANSKHSSEKRKKEPKKSAVDRQFKKSLKKNKVPVETSSTKNGENFDRLQLLKGKLIRKLGEKWLPYENITDTLDNFPYYINENTRDLLVDCIAARLKNHDLSMFGEALPSSSHLILLQGQSGTELYQEALVRAIARHLQVSLLVVDSNTLSAKDLKDDAHIAGAFTEERNNDDDEKVAANGVVHAENIVNPEATGFASFDRVNQMFGCPVKILTLKNPRRKFDLPWKVLRFPAKKEYRKEISRLVEVDNSNWADELKNLVVTGREDELRKLGKQGHELKKFWHDLIIGDHVRYIGPKATKAKLRDKVSIGQEGFVSSISDGLPWKVCVKFQGDAEEVFCNAAELEKVDPSSSDEAWLARFPELPFEALCKMVLYRGSVIVHFPDIQQWFSSAPSSKGRALLLKRVKDLLSKVNGPVAFIASRMKEDSSAPAVASMGLESMLTSIFLAVTKATPVNEAEEDMDGVLKVFKNIIKVFPPEEPQLLRIWQKQLEEDKKNARRKRTHMLLEESLEKNCLNCAELQDINIIDLQLTPESAEDVIGWARNMMFYSNQIQASCGKLVVERRCLEKALLRLKALKVTNEEKMSYIAELAENEYEKSLVSSIVLANDIGIKLNDIGALDDVKSTLKELIVLPLQRPELFRRGNLRKPCKGVLLFGPPGTGKTLVAKAVATEAGANFINVSASSITSQWYGDGEKLVRALFALARKLSPVVIFLDEVDSLLGARDSSEHEATRVIKNEFMAGWDGLQSKESERILVFATTNRPFDLDDAVIRRLPRRLLVDLPNAENRANILRIILANEDLDNTFSHKALATQTEGYSGSDLKNLCVAAAYTPIREFLEAEQQAKACNEAASSPSQTIRSLCLNDFLQAKTKIGASLAYDAASMIQLRQWNEQYGGGSRWQKTFGFSQ